MNYLMAIGSHQRTALLRDFFHAISYNKYRLFVFSFLFILGLYIFFRSYLDRKKYIKWVVTTFIFTNVADIFLAITNTQNFTLWLTPLILAIISVMLLRPSSEFSFDLNYRFKLLRIFVFALSVSISLALVIGRELPTLILEKNINLNIPEERLIHSKYLSDLYLPKEMIRPNEINFVERLNDGFVLLQSVKDLNHHRIINLDFSNPFNFALGMRSPNGVLLYWHLNKSFDMLTHLDPVSEFKDVSIIMIPVESVSGNDKELWQIYGGYISENFHLERESKHWRMFLKNSSK